MNGDGIDLVTFSLGGDPYAVELGSVREVLPDLTLTPGPDAMPFLAGVVELREETLPVVDLRARFGFGSADETGQILVLRQPDAAAVGARVDALGEVRTVPGTDLRTPPRYFGDEGARCLRGLVLHDGVIIPVIDAAAVLSNEEAGALVNLEFGRGA